jgi:hypothetical protein
MVLGEPVEHRRQVVGQRCRQRGIMQQRDLVGQHRRVARRRLADGRRRQVPRRGGEQVGGRQVTREIPAQHHRVRPGRHSHQDLGHPAVSAQQHLHGRHQRDRVDRTVDRDPIRAGPQFRHSGRPGHSVTIAAAMSSTVATGTTASAPSGS